MIHCIDRVNEYVSKGVEAGFSIFNKLFPWEFSKSVKVSMSYVHIVLKEAYYFNHYSHRIYIS